MAFWWPSVCAKRTILPCCQCNDLVDLLPCDLDRDPRLGVLRHAKPSLGHKAVLDQHDCGFCGATVRQSRNSNLVYRRVGD